MSVSTVCRERRRNSNAKGLHDGHVAVFRTKRCKGKPPGNRAITPYVRSRGFELIRKERWCRIKCPDGSGRKKD
ncbi:MAG: hypothetical protein IKS70_01615 [Bacteroides sp.]|nr:hypothetical protein [Bacteroides sp.]